MPNTFEPLGTIYYSKSIRLALCNTQPKNPISAETEASVVYTQTLRTTHSAYPIAGARIIQ